MSSSHTCSACQTYDIQSSLLTLSCFVHHFPNTEQSKNFVILGDLSLHFSPYLVLLGYIDNGKEGIWFQGDPFQFLCVLSSSSSSSSSSVWCNWKEYLNYNFSRVTFLTFHSQPLLNVFFTTPSVRDLVCDNRVVAVIVHNCDGSPSR